MKIKFKQSVYVVSEKRIFNVNDEFDFSDEQSKDLVKAGFAELIKEEAPVAVATPEDKPKSKRKARQEVGE